MSASSRPASAAQETWAEELPPGTRAGECVISQAIASGGCGTVYDATHLGQGRRVAVKVLHRKLAGSTDMVERFFREARVVAQLRDPHIVEVHGFGELQDGRPFFVMEFLPGENLGALLKRRGRLSAWDALSYLQPVCEALAAAHGAGIVHRDLKASNVAILSDEDPPVVKLLDFGIAKLLHPDPGERDLTAVGQRVGSPLSMAPEQLLGDVIGPAADIYALGVLLFRLLTGTYPFHSRSLREIERLHLKAPPPRPSSLAPVSPQVDRVVLRCLEKRPEHRFPSVAAFVEALREAVVGPPRPSRMPAEYQGTKRVAVIYLEVNLFEGIDDDVELLAALGAMLDAAEADLLKTGFRLRQSTGNAILAERILADDPARERSERAYAMRLARALLARAEPLRARGHHPVTVHVHAGPVEVRWVGGEEMIHDGDTVRVDTWVTEEAGGILATREALAGIGACHL